MQVEFPVTGTLVDPQKDLLLPPLCMLPSPALPGLGWAGSLGGSPLHRHSSPLYPSWQTKHGSPPDFSSSLSIIYFFSFTFSHCSLPLRTPFILFLSISSCPLAHRRPSLPTPAIPASFIFSGHLPHRLLMGGKNGCRVSLWL